MPRKHSNSERIGDPGASHENAMHPEKSRPAGQRPKESHSDKRTGISGGGERVLTLRRILLEGGHA